MPRVGGKEYPYTKAGMAAAKKAAAKKTSNSSSREAMQKKNRGAAVAAQDKKTVKADKLGKAQAAARGRLNRETSWYDGFKENVKSNRIRSKGYTEETFGETINGVEHTYGEMFPRRTSDALQRGYRVKQGSTGAMKSRMNARKKGAR